MSISEAIRAWFLEPVLQTLKHMEEKTMAQLDDLNAAIQAEDVQVSTLADSIKKVDADIDALLAAAKGGASATDLTVQIAAVKSHTAALSTAVDQLAAEDAKVNPPAPTTPPVA